MNKGKKISIVTIDLILIMLVITAWIMCDGSCSFKGKADGAVTTKPAVEYETGETEEGYEMIMPDEAKKRGESYMYIRGTVIVTRSGGYMLITDPAYCTIYTEQTPINLQPGKKNPITKLLQGDEIEIMCYTVEELWPCQTKVLGYQVLNHNSSMVIDFALANQLAEYGWIDPLY